MKCRRLKPPVGRAPEMSQYSNSTSSKHFLWHIFWSVTFYRNFRNSAIKLCLNECFWKVDQLNNFQGETVLIAMENGSSPCTAGQCYPEQVSPFCLSFGNTSCIAQITPHKCHTSCRYQCSVSVWKIFHFDILIRRSSLNRQCKSFSFFSTLRPSSLDSQVFYQHQMAPSILRIARDREKRPKSLYCWAQRSLGGL